METITIWTDGSARFNPGPGGFGAILKYKEHVKEISCGYRHTTNNRMELLAVIEAIRRVKNKGYKLNIYSDSSYVVNSIEKGWVYDWQKKNFKGKKNSDLWKIFLEISKDFNINMIWVKGHATNKGNNRCDELATTASSETNKENWLVDSIYENSQN